MRNVQIETFYIVLCLLVEGNYIGFSTENRSCGVLKGSGKRNQPKSRVRVNERSEIWETREQKPAREEQQECVQVTNHLFNLKNTFRFNTGLKPLTEILTEAYEDRVCWPHL